MRRTTQKRRRAASTPGAFPPLTSRERNALAVADHVLMLRSDRLRAYAKLAGDTPEGEAMEHVGYLLRWLAEPCRDLDAWIQRELQEERERRAKERQTQASVHIARPSVTDDCRALPSTAMTLFDG